MFDNQIQDMNIGFKQGSFLIVKKRIQQIKRTYDNDKINDYFNQGNIL